MKTNKYHDIEIIEWIGNICRVRATPSMNKAGKKQHMRPSVKQAKTSVGRQTISPVISSGDMHCDCGFSFGWLSKKELWFLLKLDLNYGLFLNS